MKRIRFWFHPISRSSFCGFWYWGDASGSATHGFILKAPWNIALYSERYGSRKPILRFMGWRLFGPMRST